MRRPSKPAIVIMVVAGVIILTVVALAVSLASKDTSLQFMVRDGTSKAWVWDLTARAENRTSLSFFQSDAGPVTQKLTHLSPGQATLFLSAPDYQEQAIPVVLRRGVNRLASPVEMTGLEIPKLDHWIIFEKAGDQGIICELRPVGTDGKAVVNHPCLPLWVASRVSVETKDGLPVQNETEKAARGAELFRGQMPWKWDPTPETLYRYTALIAAARMKPDSSPYQVIDYLIVVPDPLQISPEELDALMRRAWTGWAGPDMSGIAAELDKGKSRLRYFISTSWNVKAGGQ